MARVAGIDLPKAKRIDVALTYVYGIGLVLSKKLLAEAEIDPAKRVNTLTEAEVNKLNNLITKNYKVEGDLRERSRPISAVLWKLVRTEVSATAECPVRGQRTKTNARTRRGRRKTVGAGKAEPKK